MTEWCLAHPWMTFMIAMQVASGPLLAIRYYSRKTTTTRSAK